MALQSFEAKLHKLKEDRDNIVKSKDALELADTAQPSVHAEKLNVALEELQDLKGECRFKVSSFGHIISTIFRSVARVEPRLRGARRNEG